MTNRALLGLAIASSLLCGCAPKPAEITGRVSVTLTNGETVGLSAVMIGLYDLNDALEHLQSQRESLETDDPMRKEIADRNARISQLQKQLEELNAQEKETEPRRKELNRRIEEINQKIVQGQALSRGKLEQRAQGLRMIQQGEMQRGPLEQELASLDGSAPRGTIQKEMRSCEDTIAELSRKLHERDAAFYAKGWPVPLRTARTEADGSFRLKVPPECEYALVAYASRELIGRAGEEKYLWVVRVRTAKSGEAIELPLNNLNTLDAVSLDALLSTPDE